MPFTSVVSSFGHKDVMGRLQWLMIHTIIYLMLQVDSFSPIHFLREEKKWGKILHLSLNLFQFLFMGLKITVDRQIALHCLLK